MADLGASELTVERTPIDGLLVLRLPVHGDERGWFKENWQREKMVALGLPDFHPVQNNISFNEQVGVTRGIHAEPWDKLVSVATGAVFAAWVDLREGPGFGATFSIRIDPGTSVFVPRGVGNAYQTLEPRTAYSYLVNAHWRPGISYPAIALDDPQAAIPWPIPLSEATISDKDLANPTLAELTPIPGPATLILGGSGQLGQELRRRYPQALAPTRAELDLSSAASVAAFDFAPYSLVINAAAMTDVDGAQSPQGRRDAWAANAHGPALLARAALTHGFTLVHISSEYVFDGEEEVHSEDELFAPLGVYGQSKSAGDLAVSVLPRHYLVRTSWVLGEGNNFVATMERLATSGVSPKVVDDQIGRPTPAATLAAGIEHLVRTGAPFGSYNLSGGGQPRSWAQIARETFIAQGREGDDITPVSTQEYFAQARAEGRAISPRPANSTLDLSKITEAGFTPDPA